MKLLLMPILLLLSADLVLGAQGPDEQYVRVYQTIQEADRLNEQGQTRAAATKYVEAQQELNRFRVVYPGWNERVVNYRLSYVATKLAPLIATPTVPGAVVPASTSVAPAVPAVSPATPSIPVAPAAPVVSTPPPVTPMPATPPVTLPPPSAVELEQQLKPMQAELERLQAENRLLGAKLKEALSVQPASVDPREMLRAEERIRGLQKENELFKAQLAQKEAPPAVAPVTLAKNTESAETLAALRTENDVLKKQAQEWQKKYEALETAANKAKAKAEKKAEPKAEPTPKPSRKQDTALAKLSAENLALQKQAALWQQVAVQKQSAVPPQTPPAPVVSAAPVPSAATLPPDAQRELEALRARVSVFEAKPVPYTTEELALFNRAPVTTPSATSVALAVASPSAPVTTPVTAPSETPARPVSRAIPPGAGPLMRAAEGAFARGDYPEAERKYLEVLRQDENNITTLGNLASAQVEMGHFADAEKIVQRALKVDPDDDFSLYVLGRIRFHEDKLDEALDALSRSAKSNPDYVDTQNYLGIVLSEKGLRGPAEAALRRAIQLQPDNAMAHNNLAVVYATQKTPAFALARWHYHKAISLGHPKNAELEKTMDYKP